jgi:hypothetical protein
MRNATEGVPYRCIGSAAVNNHNEVRRRKFNWQLFAGFDVKEDAIQVPPPSSQGATVFDNHTFHVVKTPLEPDAIPNVNGRRSSRVLLGNGHVDLLKLTISGRDGICLLFRIPRSAFRIRKAVFTNFAENDVTAALVSLIIPSTNHFLIRLWVKETLRLLRG